MSVLWRDIKPLGVSYTTLALLMTHKQIRFSHWLICISIISLMATSNNPTLFQPICNRAVSAAASRVHLNDGTGPLCAWRHCCWSHLWSLSIRTERAMVDFTEGHKGLLHYDSHWTADASKSDFVSYFCRNTLLTLWQLLLNVCC